MADKRPSASITEHVLAIQRELAFDHDVKERAERETARVVQIEKGQCNVIPLPRVATRPFRTELTIEQNSLFVANTYKGESFVRESSVTHPESGEEVIRRMTVGKVHATDRERGVLRQIHQDVFYKVLELWGRQGYQVGKLRNKVYGTIRVSAYELVTAVFSGGDSAKGYRRTRELLRDLTAIPVVLENVYTWQGLKDREEFSLLSEVTWSERSVGADGRPAVGGESTVTILLSSLVTEGFLARHIKVLLGKPYEELDAGRGRRSEIARLLYPFLDAQLATKDTYHAKLDALAERFGLQRYPYASKRKEKFEPAMRALNGKLIHEGRNILRVSLQPSADGKDYVLRAHREAASAR